MRKWLGLVACFGLMALPAAAQFKGGNTPSFEIGGGYEYQSFNEPSYGITPPVSRLAMNGWFATVSYNVTPFLGVVTDVDWTREGLSKDNIFGDGGPDTNTVSTAVVGPRIYPVGHHRITPFGQVEFGLAHFATTLPSSTGCGTSSSDVGPCTTTDGSFAVSAGGGVDFSLTKNIAVRVAEFDWDQTRMFEPGGFTGNSNQNNWKVKAGIVFRLGER
jgi:opacity protein-like surface antigen